ncbi:hypothetical protein HYDPIDRAFT_90354 [Hydnomerulius pinastri MD-312]|uniref:tyrosinase n=1 Tax=Hydnomerulius pinastri MD-312 TaxID=994086 RepID=A0A0C9WFQ9_9AGAM|nr:hypothetical protein HYDPIDRAFT_90354 [Hydnomerulius pinastri MD-312]
MLIEVCWAVTSFLIFFDWFLQQAIGEYVDALVPKIVEQHPEEAGNWKPAARKLRFPYWDWADPKVAKDGVPSLFCDETLHVKVPGLGGKTAPVRNPLAYFNFGDNIPKDFAIFKRDNNIAHFNKWTRTFRYASNDEKPSESNIAKLQEELKKKAESIRRQVSTLFAFSDVQEAPEKNIYDEFSNTNPESLTKGTKERRVPEYHHSLEGVHNTIHGTMGGNGHMSNPDYAAFDPFFFFHHANCDRLLALWEWCYPNYWIGDGYVNATGENVQWTQQMGNRKVGGGISEQTTAKGDYLSPFMKEDRTYWTSEDTRFLTPESGVCKYYSYPEFLGIKVNEPASVEERINARTKLMAYYGYDALTAKNQLKGGVQHVAAGDFMLPAHYKVRRGFRVFQVHVRLPEFAFNGSYEFQLSYARLGKNDLFVGPVTVFARGDDSACEACEVRRENGTDVHGVVSIPPSFVNEMIRNSKIDRSQLTPEITADLIKKHLRGELKDVSTTTLAFASNSGDVVASSAELASELAPREVTLLSSSVAEDPDDSERPACSFDWKPHGEVFTVC